MDEFVVDIVRLLLVILTIPLETTMVLSVATVGLHKFIAEILKLIEVPTCTSKQLVNGKKIGFCEHDGCGRT